jgi:hypothetical protein
MRKKIGWILWRMKRILANIVVQPLNESLVAIITMLLFELKCLNFAPFEPLIYLLISRRTST